LCLAPYRALLCSMPQPLVAVPSFMFVNAFKAMLPLALGFAAGCMVWMVFAELIPDALEAAAHGKVCYAGLAGTGDLTLGGDANAIVAVWH
jgi:zinc transporter ZupT